MHEFLLLEISRSRSIYIIYIEFNLLSAFIPPASQNGRRIRYKETLTERLRNYAREPRNLIG